MVSGPGKFFSVPPARADYLRIFTINWKDRHSVTERLGLGKKGLIFVIDE